MIAASQRSMVIVRPPSRIVAQGDIAKASAEQSEDEADPEDVLHGLSPTVLARRRPHESSAVA